MNLQTMVGNYNNNHNASSGDLQIQPTKFPVDFSRHYNKIRVNFILFQRCTNNV